MRDQLVDVAGAIQKGVIGVQMQVGKLNGHTASLVVAACCVSVRKSRHKSSTIDIG